ncbi:hypothetical protein F2P81_002304 [Scophthalmus maximus]|uniref:Uncharacterized protein n=1 Tax=Scophthalmus maximus TaxID=52904 RepID=A0A6A4TKM5_SCOMX|nr:hypothetical protein F2P81_002304 [Scophthalmus maximus]
MTVSPHLDLGLLLLLQLLLGCLQTPGMVGAKQMGLIADSVESSDGDQENEKMLSGPVNQRVRVPSAAAFKLRPLASSYAHRIKQ